MPDLKTWGYRLITEPRPGLGGSAMRAGLQALSWGYGLGVRAARGLYDTRLRRPCRLPRPVVSVGNLTWGGTGKTPLTAHLARALQLRGARPAILLRGYGGDEPTVLRMLAPNVPVIVGADRAAGGRAAIAGGADLLLLDDGFQHWRLHRDLDIVLLDAAAPFGNGHLLPRGSLREPVGALRRAGVVVITKSDAADPAPVVARVRALQPAAWVTTARYRPTAFTEWPSGTPQPLAALRGARAAVLSGIADPASFERLVQTLGVEPVLTRRFLDHHPYQTEELTALAEAGRREGAAWVVTTLKDAVRFPTTVAWGGVRVAVVRVTMEMAGEAELLQRILFLRGR